MSKNIDLALKIAENQYDREMNSKFSARMRKSVEDSGSIDGFRNTILGSVASENYTRAIEDLQVYLESKSEYPSFRIKAERYLNYCVDLINAIKVKRSFPGLSHLSMAKQQELFDKAMEHFEELKETLKKIDQIDRQVRLEDVRSTVWVIQAMVYSVFAVLVLAFLLEVSRGVLPSANQLIDEAFGDFVNDVFDHLGL